MLPGHRLALSLAASFPSSANASSDGVTEDEASSSMSSSMSSSTSSTESTRPHESRRPQLGPSWQVTSVDDVDGLDVPMLDTATLRYELVDLATAAQLLRDILRDSESGTPPEEAVRIAGSMQKRLATLAQRLHDAVPDDADA